MAESRKSPEITKELSEQKASVESECAPQVEHPTPAIENKMTLDQWIDSIMSRPQDDTEGKKDYRPTVNLSRFGLKTPEDVKIFLHSPAGEAVIGEIGAQLALDKAITEDQEFKAREHRLLMNRLKALLFKWYLAEKADEADKIRDIIMQLNELALERAKSSITSSQPANTKRSQELALLLTQYDDALRRTKRLTLPLMNIMELTVSLTVSAFTYGFSILAYGSSYVLWAIGQFLDNSIGILFSFRTTGLSAASNWLDNQAKEMQESALANIEVTLGELRSYSESYYLINKLLARSPLNFSQADSPSPVHTQLFKVKKKSDIDYEPYELSLFNLQNQ